MSYKITWKLHVACNALAILMMIPLLRFIESANESIISMGLIFIPTKWIIVNYFIYTLFIVIIVTIVHELIHGTAYKVFGGKVKYGYRIIYAYTMEISEIPIKRNYFLVVLLSPLVILSLIFSSFNNFFCYMALVVNMTGSSGGIIMAFTLLRYSRECKIIDRSYGYDVVENVEEA